MKQEFKSNYQRRTRVIPGKLGNTRPSSHTERSLPNILSTPQLAQDSNHRLIALCTECSEVHTVCDEGPTCATDQAAIQFTEAGLLTCGPA